MELVKPTNEVVSNRIMMPGTSQPYLCIARKGEMLLGIRAYPLQRMSKGVTGAPIRVHVSKDAETLEKLTSGTVVKLQQTPASYEAAFPNVKFESISPSRAATSVVGFVRGDFTTDPVKFMENWQGTDHAQKAVDYLVSIIGLENFVIEPREVRKYLAETWQEYITYVEKNIAAQKIAEELVEASVGQFGIQADMLKQLHSKMAAMYPVADAEGDETEEQEDED
jgi:hypothetical protein